MGNIILGRYTLSEEEKLLNDRFHNKLMEYKNQFGDFFSTECLPMTKEEIIENIDKCIKNNRRWEGYIVPMLDEDDEI